MDVIIKQHKDNDYYVYISIETVYYNTVYKVGVCRCYDNCLCGYPEREMVYPISDNKKALATYKRYVKKYCTIM